MHKIFIDLEMHPVARAYSEPFKMLKKETIEIGAVMLDEQLREIASFKEYVRPSYSDKIYPKYQKLTGITTEMLKSADSFQSVFRIIYRILKILQQSFTKGRNRRGVKL